MSKPGIFIKQLHDGRPLFRSGGSETGHVRYWFTDIYGVPVTVLSLPDGVPGRDATIEATLAAVVHATGGKKIVDTPTEAKLAKLANVPEIEAGSVRQAAAVVSKTPQQDALDAIFSQPGRPVSIKYTLWTTGRDWAFGKVGVIVGMRYGACDDDVRVTVQIDGQCIDVRPTELEPAHIFSNEAEVRAFDDVDMEQRLVDDLSEEMAELAAGITAQEPTVEEAATDDSYDWLAGRLRIIGSCYDHTGADIQWAIGKVGYAVSIRWGSGPKDHLITVAIEDDHRSVTVFGDQVEEAKAEPSPSLNTFDDVDMEQRLVDDLSEEMAKLAPLFAAASAEEDRNDRVRAKVMKTIDQDAKKARYDVNAGHRWCVGDAVTVYGVHSDDDNWALGKIGLISDLLQGPNGQQFAEVAFVDASGFRSVQTDLALLSKVPERAYDQV